MDRFHLHEIVIEFKTECCAMDGSFISIICTYVIVTKNIIFLYCFVSGTDDMHSLRTFANVLMINTLSVLNCKSMNNSLNCTGSDQMVDAL